MAEAHRVTRRTFLRNLGAGTFTIAVLGPLLAACGDDDATDAATSSSSEPPPTAEGPRDTTGPATTPPSTEASTTTNAPETTGMANGAVTLQRVSLGFVSAYVLARDGEAAIVDTGIPGSAGEIEAGLAEVGLGWANVGSVILTHLHNDHIGGLGDVMAAAAEADGFAGAADIPAIPSPRPLTAVGDEDTVFGLTIIETPGHTAGHISVLDPFGGILVAGDALNGVDGGIRGANPQFSSDMSMANESVAKLAGFDFDTAVFGHGEPVRENASQLVADLAATL